MGQVRNVRLAAATAAALILAVATQSTASPAQASPKAAAAPSNVPHSGLFGLGDNSASQLGTLPSARDPQVPTALSLPNGAVAAHVETVDPGLGVGHTLVLTTAGTVFSVGGAVAGKCFLTIPTVSHFTAVQFPQSHLRFTLIAQSSCTSYAEDLSGQLWSWGDGEGGQLGNGEPVLAQRYSAIPVPADTSAIAAPIRALSCREEACVGIDHLYRLFGFGSGWPLGPLMGVAGFDGPFTKPILAAMPIPLGNLKFVSVALGSTFGLAATSTGAVVVWGSDNVGQLGIGITPSGSNPCTAQFGCAPTVVHFPQGVLIAQVVATNASAAVRSTAGAVFTWGAARVGQLGVGSNILKYYSFLSTPSRVHHLGPVAALCAGGDSVMAIRRDHHVSTWGWAANGNLGYTNHGAIHFFPSPTELALPTGVVPEGCTMATTSSVIRVKAR